MNSLYPRSGDSWRNLSAELLDEARFFLDQGEQAREPPTASDVGFLRFFKREFGSYHNDACAAICIERSYYFLASVADSLVFTAISLVTAANRCFKSRSTLHKRNALHKEAKLIEREFPEAKNLTSSSLAIPQSLFLRDVSYVIASFVGIAGAFALVSGVVCVSSTIIQAGVVLLVTAVAVKTFAFLISPSADALEGMYRKQKFCAERLISAIDCRAAVLPYPVLDCSEALDRGSDLYDPDLATVNAVLVYSAEAVLVGPSDSSQLLGGLSFAEEWTVGSTT